MIEVLFGYLLEGIAWLIGMLFKGIILLAVWISQVVSKWLKILYGRIKEYYYSKIGTN